VGAADTVDEVTLVVLLVLVAEIEVGERFEVCAVEDEVDDE
jgi:hypothetical protein